MAPDQLLKLYTLDYIILYRVAYMGMCLLYYYITAFETTRVTLESITTAQGRQKWSAWSGYGLTTFDASKSRN